jgi:alkanesulfonate monooxygenase SsuD/methylene tetrahydromethanopterin reductase-like flavin-dependent oxidoreductase (luciferase family)
VASQVLTLDNLSGGRVILSVGLGVANESRFWMFEDDPGRKVRAEMLDEGLELIELLCQGQAFEYTGRHYRAHRPDMMIPPPSTQQPRVTTWVVGLWPAKRSMRRSARWDGWLPNFADVGGPGLPPPEKLAEAVTWIAQERAGRGLGMEDYDVVVEGTTEPGQEAVAQVQAWADAGATWWLEAAWGMEGDVTEQCRARLRAGPPRG